MLSHILELLEVDIPNPGHVLSVGDPVVQREQERAGLAELDRGSQDLVESGGILGQQQDRRTAVDGGALHPPEGRREIAQRRRSFCQRHAHRVRGRQRQDDVVGVVETRKWDLEIGPLIAIGDLQAHALHALDCDRGCPDLG